MVDLRRIEWCSLEETGVFLVTPTRRHVVALLATLLIAVVTATAALPVAAQTVDACSDQFTVLQAHAQAVPITGGKVDKERAGLVKLVVDAQALASIGKTTDAITKLGDFTVKVDQLEAAGRISAESAALLRADADAASACLQGTP
jgi:hypothetical protein